MHKEFQQPTFEKRSLAREKAQAKQKIRIII